MSRYLIFCLLLLSVGARAQSSQDSVEFASFYYDALKYVVQENNEQALVALARCVDLRPDEPSVWFLRGKLVAQAHDLDDALRALKKAHAGQPDNPWYLDALVRTYVQAGKTGPAYDALRHYIDRHPDASNERLLYAQLLEANGQLRDAITAYEAYLQIESHDETVQTKLIRLYFSLGDFRMALQRTNAYLADNPDDYRLAILKCELLLKTDQWDEARDVFQDLVRRFPDEANVRSSYAEFLLLSGDTVALHAELPRLLQDKSLEVSRKIDLIRQWLGSQATPTQAEQADSLLSVLLQQHPESFEANYLYGSYLFDRQQYVRAANWLGQARRLQANHLRIWVLEANAYLSASNYNRLLQQADSAQLYYPSAPEVYLFQGIARLRTKAYEGAWESLSLGSDLLLTSDPLYADYLGLMAETQHALGNLPKAFELYEQAIAVSVDNPVLVNNYCYYLALAKQRLARAKELMESLLGRGNTDYKYLDTYAWVLYGLGTLPQALEAIDQSIAGGGANAAVVHEHRGAILRALNRPEEALSAYRRALELEPANTNLQTQIDELLRK